uniref:CUB and Sushi multiple domains 2 n=1 Tax=Meleagris gallopavo TaxID=9103 RepID=A0A803XZU0_MELGA
MNGDFLFILIAKCGGTLTNMGGVILSPGFPGNYPSNLDCTWKILLPIGYERNYRTKSAHIQFLNFSTEANHDFLEIQNGPYHTSSMIGQFSGMELPSPLLSTTHETLVHFYSDHSENRQGFKLTYQASIASTCNDPGTPQNGTRYGDSREPGDTTTFQCDPGYQLQGQAKITCVQLNNRFFWQPDPPTCIAACGGNLTGPAGVILSPNYPQPYPPGKECDWRIKVNPDFVIALIFKSFNMEPSYDFLHIYEGEDSNSPLIGSFQGSQAPERIESSGNSLFLAFRSDASVGMSGFAIDYKGILLILICGNI